MIILVNTSVSKQQFHHLKFPPERKIEVIPETDDMISRNSAVLNTDPVGELTDEFSICSSIYIGYFRDFPTFFMMIIG